MERSRILDTLRGVAILGMISYHTAFDLDYFWGWDIDTRTGLWKIFSRATASLFILISGIVIALSEERTHPSWKKRIVKNLSLLFAALLVTWGTFMMNPETYIRFGILHFLLVARFFAPFLLRLRVSNLVLAVLLLGLSFTKPWIGSNFFLPLGITEPSFATLDYFPLVPWLGVFCIGLAIPSISHAQKFLNIHIPQTTTIAWLGRHSLIIYLLHQPLLLLGISIVLGKPI